MYVPCWNCGTEAWIETQVECRDCRSVVRRCNDCVNLTGTHECAVYQVEITESDRLTPTTLSLSYKCPHYKVAPEALTRLQEAASRMQAGGSEVAEDATPSPVEPSQAQQDAAEHALPDQPEPVPEAQPVRPQPRKVIVIGHRGSSTLAPENTLAAIRAGLDAGAAAIEVDVQITKDGKAVCIHNATLPRTTTGTGWVVESTLAELKKLDAGSWFGPGFAGEEIPELGEALAAIPAPTWVNIHLRAHENESDRCERAVVEAIQEAGCEKRAWITHHTRHGLYRIRKMMPKLRVCWISRGGESDNEYIDDAYYMGFRILQPTIHLVTRDFVEYAHSMNMWVNVSYARTKEDIARLLDMGVDGIFAGNPGLVHAVQKEREKQATES
jgi:glycerophosphoryl diester phosphodiesterase